MIYLSNRIFRVWAYTVSHSILLLRSQQLFEDVDNYSNVNDHNIDIEFWGVAYMELPDTIKSITIECVQNEIPEKIKKYSSNLENKFFRIKLEQDIFYVVASGCRVGKNNWLNEDRITNPYLDYSEVLAIF